MLLVHNGKAQILKDYAVADEGVRAHNKVNGAISQTGHDLRSMNYVDTKHKHALKTQRQSHITCKKLHST